MKELNASLSERTTTTLKLLYFWKVLLAHFLSWKALFKYHVKMKHESPEREVFSWCFFMLRGHQWTFVPNRKKSDLLSVGNWLQMRYQQDWQLLRGSVCVCVNVCWGGCRLCEVAIYPQVTKGRDDVSKLKHSPNCGDQNAAQSRVSLFGWDRESYIGLAVWHWQRGKWILTAPPAELLSLVRQSKSDF